MPGGGVLVNFEMLRNSQAAALCRESYRFSYTFYGTFMVATWYFYGTFMIAIFHMYTLVYMSFNKDVHAYLLNRVIVHACEQCTMQHDWRYERPCLCSQVSSTASMQCYLFDVRRVCALR